MTIHAPRDRIGAVCHVVRMTSTDLITFDKSAPGQTASITEVGRDRLTKDRANGLSQATCAARLGISVSTLRAIMDKDEDVKAAYDTGTGAMQDELVGILMAAARDGDRTSAIFLLKGACGFREVGAAPDAPSQSNTPAINIMIPAMMPSDQLETMTASMRTVSTSGEALDASTETNAPKGLTHS